ncbi:MULTISPECIES: hypothetical protein [Cyanophyceae]|nr:MULTISPECIES: hypothetical protein [Cyanophyceae]
MSISFWIKIEIDSFIVPRSRLKRSQVNRTGDVQVAQPDRR